MNASNFGYLMQGSSNCVPRLISVHCVCWITSGYWTYNGWRYTMCSSASVDQMVEVIGQNGRWIETQMNNTACAEVYCINKCVDCILPTGCTDVSVYSVQC